MGVNDLEAPPEKLWVKLGPSCLLPVAAFALVRFLLNFAFFRAFGC